MLDLRSGIYPALKQRAGRIWAPHGGTLGKILTAIGLLLPGCASQAPATSMAVTVTSPVLTRSVITTSAVVSNEMQTLSPDDIRKVMDTAPDSAYELGPNDIIALTVYLHPELSVPATGITSNIGGAMITSDGSVALPLIGTIHLGGLSLAAANAAVTEAFAAYIKNPKIAVQLVQAQSLRYYLLGAFTSPGIKYPAQPLSLLEALALGGSVDIPQADLFQAYVAQGPVKLPVDLQALLIDGDLSQNIQLASGDTIVIPSSVNENAFVFGAVGKPGAVQFQSGALSLLQALGAADLDLQNITDARLSDVHIIRAHGRTAEFLIVDADKILHGHAMPFALQPGDIVFVPATVIGTWNQILSQLIPSLQAASDVLNPFVSIKYLERN